jgi:hypothetical protein
VPLLGDVEVGDDEPVIKKTATTITIRSATTPPKMRKLRLDDVAGSLD